jgi:phosphoglucosamine mutase
MAAGLAGAGVDVFDAGFIPAPAAAYLVADLAADFGVMVSASRDPAQDNGIKFLAFGGRKLSDADEAEVEAELLRASPHPVGAGVGRIQPLADAEDIYVAHLLSSLPHLPHRLDGLTVVLDCAHGAPSHCSPRAFEEAGANVVVIGADPDGLNINEGYGSTHLEKLQSAVPTAQTSALPTTGALTVAWRWTTSAAASMGTKSWPSWQRFFSNPRPAVMKF